MSIHCPSCGSTLEAHTERMSKCTVCVRFDNITVNASRPRRGGRIPRLSLTRRQFATWFAQQDRTCTYCGVQETDLHALGVRTSVGHALQRLGIDRVNTARGYTRTNMVLCCYACNKVKSNTFTDQEMRQLGATVAAIWLTRLTH